VPGTYPSGVSVFALVLLVAAVVLVVAAEWPAIVARTGIPSRPRRRKQRHLRVVPEETDDDFAASVERDLAALPTIDERDRKRR
jgi:hypothetical protein